jgi:hypothetical protein
LVGGGAAVGISTSVAVASGEQAANPLITPIAPTFNASLRVIFLFLVHRSQVKHCNNLSR